MKITQDNTAISIEGDVFESIETKVDSSKLIKLYGMLSNIYRNPIGSIIREYTSNAHDANVEAHNFKTLNYKDACQKYSWLNSKDSELAINETEYYNLQEKLTKAGKDEPIVIGIDQMESMFYVKDYGIGLSPERMRHVFFSYLSSTKEDTNDEIGGFGIGAKSALAYTDTFFIETVYCGVLYKYMMTKEETGMPVGKFMLSMDTDQDNGTTIKVPIKDSTDKVNFMVEIDKKLLYVPNLYVNEKDNLSSILNDSKILKGKGWAISTASPENSSMHIILDNIHYDIDWTELDMYSINVPVGLVFKTGEILPTPSRESVLYTKQSRAIIKNRMKAVIGDIYNIYTKEMSPTHDFKKAFKSWKSAGNNFVIDEELNISINIKDLLNSDLTKGSNFVPYANWIPFNNTRLGFNKITKDRPEILTRTGTIQINNLNSKVPKVDVTESKYYNTTFDTQINNIMESPYIISDSSLNLKQAHHFVEKNLDKIENYCNSIHSPGWIQINIYKLKSTETLKQCKNSFKLSKYPKDNWRRNIGVYSKIIDHIKDNSLGMPVMNPNWEKLYHAGKCMFSPKVNKSIPSGSIYLKHYQPYFESSSSYKYTVPFKDLEDYNKLERYNTIVYAGSKDIKKLKVLRDFYTHLYCRNSKKYNNYTDFTAFVTCNVASYKKIKKMNLNKWIDVNDMNNGKYKTVVRLATARIMHRELGSYGYLSDSYDNLNYFSQDLEDDIRFCKEYIKDNYSRFMNDVTYSKKNDTIDIINEMCDFLIDSNLLDQNAVSKYQRIEKHLSKSDMFYCLFRNNRGFWSSDSRVKLYVGKTLRKEGVPVNDIFHDGTTENLLKDHIKDYNYEHLVGNVKNIMLEQPTVYKQLKTK